jgi:hypothetical protein
MDLFGFVSFLIMGGATLFGLSLLVCLVVMERKSNRSDGDQRGGPSWCPARPPRQPLVRRPPARRKSAGEAILRTRRRGSGRT